MKCSENEQGSERSDPQDRFARTDLELLFLVGEEHGYDPWPGALRTISTPGMQRKQPRKGHPHGQTFHDRAAPLKFEIMNVKS